MYAWIPVLYQICFCKYFLPVCVSPSGSLDSVFCRAEVFNFNEVQLTNFFKDLILTSRIFVLFLSLKICKSLTLNFLQSQTLCHFLYSPHVSCLAIPSWPFPFLQNQMRANKPEVLLSAVCLPGPLPCSRPRLWPIQGPTLA